jgi:pimeloyl-ACP methyl ester carboxylesterase
MAYRTPVIMAATAGAIFVPLLLVVVFPVLRSPTKRPHRDPKQLPQGVTRSFTPTGLELLVAKSSSNGTQKQVPVLMLHGGFGSALCYEKWLPYLASQGRDAYSQSLSGTSRPSHRTHSNPTNFIPGHGLSPRPSNFVTMMATDFVRDLEGALDYISALHPDQPAPILIGHSAGGGLSQAMLANTQREAPTSGVILVAGFPPTGGWPVYVNWLFADPWFGVRMLRQGGDPKSPLSSPALVQKVFFGPKMKQEDLLEFYEYMNPEESVGWPISMMFPFIDVEKVKRHTNGKVAWIGGQNDVLMSPSIMKEAAEKYHAPLTIVSSAGKLNCRYHRV